MRIVGEGREVAPRREVNIACEPQLESVRVATLGSRPCVQYVADRFDLRLASLEIVFSHHSPPLLDLILFPQQDLDHLGTLHDAVLHTKRRKRIPFR